jgi:hypothetical protein
MAIPQFITNPCTGIPLCIFLAGQIYVWLRGWALILNNGFCDIVNWLDEAAKGDDEHAEE